MAKNLLDNSGLSYFWGKIKAYFAKGNGKIFYGTCSTAAGTAAKVVTCSEFTSADLENGTLLLVKFAEANTASQSSLSLNVNGTGACYVRKIQGTSFQELTNEGEIRGTTNLFFVYKSATSTYWVFANGDLNTVYSNMTQTDLSTGTSATGLRISPKLLRDNFYTKTEIPAFVHLSDESDMPANPDANTIYMIDEATS